MPRGLLLAAALAMVLGLAGPPPAAAGSAPVTLPEPRLAPDVEALRGEVRDIAARISQIDAQLATVVREADRLAREVERLKRTPSGVMRDTQLQASLRSLSGVLVAKRSVEQKRRALQTRLLTLQVSLFRTTRAVAARQMRAAEQAVAERRDDVAAQHFAAAFDHLALREIRPAREAPRPQMRPAPPPPPRLTGKETPDEIREVAQILRDSGERIKWNGALLEQDLLRLRGERETLNTLLTIGTPPSRGGSAALAGITERIGLLERQHRQMKGIFKAYMTQAARLEARAAREESELLRRPEEAP